MTNANANAESPANTNAKSNTETKPLDVIFAEDIQPKQIIAETTIFASAYPVANGRYVYALNHKLKHIDFVMNVHGIVDGLLMGYFKHIAKFPNRDAMQSFLSKCKYHWIMPRGTEDQRFVACIGSPMEQSENHKIAQIPIKPLPFDLISEARLEEIRLMEKQMDETISMRGPDWAV